MVCFAVRQQLMKAYAASRLFKKKKKENFLVSYQTHCRDLHT